MPSQDQSLSPLEVVKSIEISGFPIEIGVLRDGTPFLSGRGLAQACGISNSTLVGWGETVPQPGEAHRAGKLANLLATYGYRGERLFVRVPHSARTDGKALISAYPYQVCLAFLDYYSFEANKEAARNSLRILSEKQLPNFIYAAMGYPPPRAAVAVAKPPRDRPAPPYKPADYFSVAQGMTGKHLRSLQESLASDLPTVPPLNLEKAWSRHWDSQRLWAQYGKRLPQPQADLSQRQLMPSGLKRTYLYPVSALPEFQQWLDWQYIPDRFPSYRQRKRQQRSLKGLPPASWVAAVTPR